MSPSRRSEQYETCKMVDYESDEAIAEIQDEMYREESKRSETALGDMEPQTKMFIGLGVAAVVVLVILEKISVGVGATIMIGGGIVMYIMMGVDSSRRELAYIECLIRLNEQLQFLQKHPIGDMPQIPGGKISVSPIGRKQWYEGRPFKRSFKVTLYDRELDLWDTYFAEVDVFTGDIITFKTSPEGVYGDETKDIKILPSFDMLMAKKRDQYLDKKNKI